MAQPQNPGQGQPKDQKYVVKVDFTDENGRTWSAGSAFTGEAEAIKKALAAGKIQERPKVEPQDPDQ